MHKNEYEELMLLLKNITEYDKIEIRLDKEAPDKLVIVKTSTRKIIIERN
jgi:hypothetical protein